MRRYLRKRYLVSHQWPPSDQGYSLLASTMLAFEPQQFLSPWGPLQARLDGWGAELAYTPPNGPSGQIWLKLPLRSFKSFSFRGQQASSLKCHVKEAEELLREVEEVAMTVGLRMNESKTKYLVENIECPDQIVSVGGKSIELVEDFVYLGARIRNTEHGLLERKRKAWLACHSLLAVWKWDLRKDLKIRLLTATVESVLLYGSETWTLTKRLTKMVDGCFTRMLRMALNITQYAMRMCYMEAYQTSVQKWPREDLD